MPIKLDETVVSLSDLSKSDFLPKRRGKRPHVSTLYRWATKGVRGIVLETIQVVWIVVQLRRSLPKIL